MVAPQKTDPEILSAAEEFYRALHDVFQGDTSSMEQIWSHADDVTYLGPEGGILVGWSQAFQAWKKVAELKLQGKLTTQEVHIFQEDNIAVMQCYEVGTNTIRGKVEQVHIRAVNVFRKEKGKWKMVSHQTDPLPRIFSNTAPKREKAF